jgi:1A family penicillin-binding protein
MYTQGKHFVSSDSQMRRRFQSFVIHRWSYIASGLLAFTLLSAVTAGVVIRRIVVDLPSPDRLYERAAAPSTRIYDRRGRLLYEILDPHGGAHAPISLADVPLACVEATVATEDASFYSNPGVDLWAIVRALWINLRGGEILSGGSTITQQLARNLLLLPEERTEISLERKLRESILAWRLARTYTKDEILTLYLNETYYGNLAYGIEAAARTHFAKSAAELDLAECALLAGLPQSPTPYNPLENPRAAKARQSVVLGLMVKHGYISSQEADLAVNEKLHFASVLFPIQAPHFVMLVRGQLERDFGLEAIYTRGLEVHTTLDLDAQNTAQRFVRHRLAQLAGSQDADRPSHEVHNAAVVVIDPHTGEVLALVGSPDYFDPWIDGAVNAAVTIRQPGSSIKPITYAAAFDPTLSDPLTAATMMVDVRAAFVTREGDPYVPRNYDHQWRGPVLLREALASSYNLIAVRVLDHVTIERMTALARSMGITTFDDADRWGLALTLGGGEVRLLELTAAYGAFANGGYRLEPVTITRVEDSHGQVLKAWDATLGPRVMDERVAHLITDILSDSFARAPTFGEGSALRLSRPAAAKTGTTSDWRDNWTVGYTPDLVVGVWTGNADNEPMQHVSGVEGAAPIWHDVMEALLKGRPVREFVEPPGMVWVEVCADSGLPPAQEAANEGFRIGNRDQGAGTGDWELRRPARCPRTITELFIDGTEPARPDDWHWWFTLDVRNGLLASSNCPPQFTAQERYTLYPAEASEWVRWQGIPRPPETYSPLCPDSQATRDGLQTTEASVPSFPHSPSSPLVMTSPDQGSHYQVSPEIPPSAQQVVVAAQPADGVALRQVTLLADGRPLATLTRPPYQALWPMETGMHQFTATGMDVEGNAVQGNQVTIEVIK